MLCIAISIIIGVFAVKYYEKRKVKEEEIKGIEIKNHYYSMLSDIMKACWDERNYIFNWAVWFHRRDEVIWTGHKFILKEIDDEFKYYGRLQVMYINSTLENLFEYGSNEIREDLKMRMKNWIKGDVNRDILLNLNAMFSFKDGQCEDKLCPETVKIYRSNLWDLLYGEIDWSQWTPEKVNKIVALGEKILREK
ncbi:MAG: hypothetical protein J1F02_05765 [Lachnospiraceae bacterium]|nr:hypothetical protein [Lachnospiraceae bacterium]